jgi:hypothetical protein
MQVCTFLPLVYRSVKTLLVADSLPENILPALNVQFTAQSQDPGDLKHWPIDAPPEPAPAGLAPRASKVAGKVVGAIQ